LIQEGIIQPSEYKIEQHVPVYGHKAELAKGILFRMNPGDSLLVLTVGMAQTMVREAKKDNKFATYKREGEAYRVWLF